MPDLVRDPICVEGGCRFAQDVGVPDQCVGVCQERVRREEYEAHMAAQLAQGLCPHSGERLRREMAWGRDSMICEMCDCFGFDPRDPRLRLHPRYPRCCPDCRSVLTRLPQMPIECRWCRRCRQVVQYPGCILGPCQPMIDNA